MSGFNAFTATRMPAGLAHQEYATVGVPRTNLGGRYSTATLADSGIDAAGIGSGGLVGYEAPAPRRDEYCVECNYTRLSRFNKGSVCAGCSNSDADRAHR